MQLSNHLTDSTADDLPPGTLFVYSTLLDDAPLTTAEIEDETMLHRSTIRDGLTRLREHDLVESRRDADNPRKHQYVVVNEDEEETALH
jgi:predicted transcriptional regulator